MIATAPPPDALKRYGSFSLAGSIDQPDMRFYGDDSGVIAYTDIHTSGRTVSLCLGEPLAPEDSWADLLHRFLGRSENALFLNIGETFGRVLLNEGFFVDCLGWEAILDLDTYDLRGPKKQNIRNAVRRIERLGFGVEEIALDGDDWYRIDRISQEWLRRKGTGRPENRLITRPLLRRNRHQRAFGLRAADGDLVHFLTIDEMWRNGRVVAYHSNINRGREDSPKNADYALNAHIIGVLRREGVPHYSLGLCPDLGWKPLGKKGNVYMNLVLDAVRRFGSGIYNLDGITAHKAEFRPSTRRPVYIATQDPWPAVPFAAVLKALNLA